MQAEEIDILKDKESTFANLHFKYDEEIIRFLKKQFERSDSLYLIAKDGDDEFAAFCSLDSDWRESDHFFLREIFVMPEYQGQGIGKQLIERCIEYAQEQKAVAIVTQTAFENAPMRKLCEKLGFQQWDNPEWKQEITYKLILT